MSSSLDAVRVVRPSPPARAPLFAVPWVSLSAAIVAAVLSVALALPAVVPWGAAVLVAASSCAEGALRGRHRAHVLHDRFRREVAAFDRDLERALAGEVDSLLRRVEGESPAYDAGPGPIVFLGRGEVASSVLVVSSTRSAAGDVTERPALGGAPLLVRAAGGIRVLGPPRLARRVARGYAAQVLRREPGSKVVRDAEGSDVVQGALTICVPRRGGVLTCRFEVGEPVGDAKTEMVCGEKPFSRPATEVWIGPDGSARARTVDQAQGTWVSVDPVLGPGEFRLSPSLPTGVARA